MDLFGQIALAWTVLYLGVRYVGATLAGRETAENPVATASEVELPARPRSGSVAIGVTAVGLVVMAAWLLRRTVANRR